MNLKHVEIFRDVASLRSFSQAARARGLSQPSVSQAIHQLEEYFGLTLLDRSTRPLELTPAGQIYFDGCRKLLDEFGRLEDAVRNAGEKVAGEVCVAAIYSVGLLELSVLLADFEQQYPDVSVDIRYVHPDEVYTLITDGEADFGLVSHPKETGEWESTLWRTQVMSIVVPTDHPWGGRSSVALQELDGVDFVALTSDLKSRRETDRLLKKAGAKPRIVHEFDNIDTIRRAVVDGAGISILPRATLKRDIEAGVLAALDIENGPFARPLGLVKRKSHPLSTAATVLADHLANDAAAQRENDAAAQREVVPKEAVPPDPVSVEQADVVDPSGASTA